MADCFIFDWTISYIELTLIKENQNLTHREIAEQLSITDKTAKRATMALRQLGMITREGSDKTEIGWLQRLNMPISIA